MLAEVFIFVPSIARFREDYLLARLERAQIASLALLADDMIDADLEQELLQQRRVSSTSCCGATRCAQLILSSPHARADRRHLRPARPDRAAS